MVNADLWTIPGAVRKLLRIPWKQKALTSQTTGYHYWWEMQLDHHETDFGGMTFWEINPQVMEQIWMMVSATWGGEGDITTAEGLRDCGRLGVTLSLVHDAIN
jgi:hypothetical protein